jgi:hypothetical protein
MIHIPIEGEWTGTRETNDSNAFSLFKLEVDIFENRTIDTLKTENSMWFDVLGPHHPRAWNTPGFILVCVELQ